MNRAKAAAGAAAFVALLAVVATVTYASARDEPTPPTTTTTTTTVRAATSAEVAQAITAALSQDLEVPLTRLEAACVTVGLVEGLGQARIEEMAAAGTADVASLTEAEHDGLVRAVVGCVPPEKAEALLSTKPPPPTIAGLPDEGVAP